MKDVRNNFSTGIAPIRVGLLLAAIIAVLFATDLRAGSDYRIYKLQYRSADSAIAFLQPQLSATGYITKDDRLNALIIFDKPAELDRLAGLIAGFDKPSNLVTMEFFGVDVEALERAAPSSPGDWVSGDGVWVRYFRRLPASVRSIALRSHNNSSLAAYSGEPMSYEGRVSPAARSWLPAGLLAYLPGADEVSDREVSRSGFLIGTDYSQGEFTLALVPFARVIEKDRERLYRFDEESIMAKLQAGEAVAISWQDPVDPRVTWPGPATATAGADGPPLGLTIMRGFESRKEGKIGLLAHVSGIQ